jgi:hypothetical protein
VKPDRPDIAPWQVRLLTMNRRQTRVLVTGIFGCILMGLFPPWEQSFVNDLGHWYDRPAGVGFILDPPDVWPGVSAQDSLNDPNYLGATVNWTRLFIQWIIAGTVTLVYVWRFRDNLQDVVAPRPRHRPPTIYR